MNTLVKQLVSQSCREARALDLARRGEDVVSRHSLPLCADVAGASTLHYAAGAGSEEVVASLLAARADPKAEDKDGLRAIHWAAKAGELGTLDARGALVVHVAAPTDHRMVQALPAMGLVPPSR